MRLQEYGDGALSELLGIARFKIHEGKIDEYKRLSAQAMELVRTKDTGTLQYDTYFCGPIRVRRHRAVPRFGGRDRARRQPQRGVGGGSCDRQFSTAKSSVSRAKS
jgi:hypothetical protein